jgi:hypothetical protein
MTIRMLTNRERLYLRRSSSKFSYKMYSSSRNKMKKIPMQKLDICFEVCR